METDFFLFSDMHLDRRSEDHRYWILLSFYVSISTWWDPHHKYNSEVIVRRAPILSSFVGLASRPALWAHVQGLLNLDDISHLGSEPSGLFWGPLIGLL